MNDAAASNEVQKRQRAQLAWASALASEVGASLRWIRREENGVADALSRSAYRAATGRVATERLASRERNVHVG